jgi:hypothetical protein
MKLYLWTEQHDKLKSLKQNCIHAEPNYGVLWFYYKNNNLDNAIEIWDRAEKQIRIETAQ